MNVMNKSKMLTTENVEYEFFCSSTKILFLYMSLISYKINTTEDKFQRAHGRESGCGVSMDPTISDAVEILTG
jgi:hypothetical protein